MTFARTKIQAPQPRATFLPRDALHDQLAQALQSRRLVLISAPAGYGKTTALANEVTALSPGHALAWISADPGDDLHRMLECMLTALEPYDPPWRTAPEALIARAAEGTVEARRAIAAEILNTLDACDVPRGIIVFEDAHRITDRAFFEFLDLLIERLSPRWNIAITTRADPPLSLARLRVADELAEFRQPQLRFTRSEARTLAAQAGLDADVADRLFRRTHGWPAGMRLAISAANVSGLGTGERWKRSREPDIDRALFDYLVVEVVDRLRPELRDFLLAVSVLPELTPARCATVSGDPRAARLLDEIERMGLFVDAVEGDGADESGDGAHAPGPGEGADRHPPVEGADDPDAPAASGEVAHGGPAGRTLRVHDLLRDALQRHLALEHPDRLDTLRRRAVETEPDPIRRVALLLAAGNAAEAATQIARHAPAMLADGSIASVVHVMKSFDAAFCRENAELQFVAGLVAWYHWDYSALLESMTRAEIAWRARGDVERELFARAYRASAQIFVGRLDEGGPLLEQMAAMDPSQLSTAARILVLNGLNWLALEAGPVAAIGPNVDEMVRLLEASGETALWYQTIPPTRLPGVPGTAQPLKRHAEALVRIAQDEATPLRAMAYLMQARRCLWEGRFAESERFVELARSDAKWTRDTAPVRAHLLAQMTLWHAIRGEHRRAIALMQQRIDEIQPGYGLSGVHHLLQFGARVAAICEDVPLMRKMHDRIDATQAQLGETVDRGRFRRGRPHRALAGNIAWIEGRVDDAIDRWSEALASETATDILGHSSDVRMRLALAHVRKGNVTAAAATLQPVFALAAAEHAAGGALLAFDALRELAGFDWRGELAEGQRATLREWSALLAAFRSGAEDAAASEGSRHSADHSIQRSPGHPAGRSPAHSLEHFPKPSVHPAGAGEPGREQADAGLTRRELEVLARVAAGDSNKLIARAFDLSLHTVKRHVAHILDKLELASRGQAAAWYRSRMPGHGGVRAAAVDNRVS